MKILDTFSDLVEKHYLVRRVVLGIMMYLVVHMYLWAVSFAATTSRPGTDVALILGAVLTPLSALFGAVIAFYNQARNGVQNVVAEK